MRYVNFNDGREQFGQGPYGPLGDRFVLWRAMKHLQRAMEIKVEPPQPVQDFVNEQGRVQMEQACKRLLYSFWKQLNDPPLS
ncbi:MAG: hypothetical protein FD180_1974 [Planctomycetota bacterium]|nr:MAG: hypothetical protein FD180_1974 [Planctomycetota bacterium]